MTIWLSIFDDKHVQRIMLVIDDFNELVGMETLFRRLGFDVLSLGRESLVAEAVLGFQADLTIATGRGRHVDGLKLAPKLRYGTSQPKLVVLLPYDSSRPAGESPSLSYGDVGAVAGVDAVIETPFDPKSALRVVAKLLGLPEDPLLEKYTKIVSARLFHPQELKVIKQAVAPTTITHVTGGASGSMGSQGAGGAAGAGGTGGLSGAAGSVAEKPLSPRESRYAKYLDDKAEEELPPIASIDVMKDARKKLDADVASTLAKASIDDAQKLAQLERERREFVEAMIEAGKPESGEVAAAGANGAAAGVVATGDAKKK